jgi:hypothetical protein
LQIDSLKEVIAQAVADAKEKNIKFTEAIRWAPDRAQEPWPAKRQAAPSGWLKMRVCMLKARNKVSFL